MKKNNRKQKRSDFAWTKKIPHANHPAYFKRRGNNDIEYVTFTSNTNPIIDGKRVKSRKLQHNVDPSKEGISDSHILDRVYVGKRNSLSSRIKGYRISKTDKQTIEDVFNTAPRINIPYTGNSNKNKKPRK